jgi:bifunctional N-acetylglucosamine-1-phosphate-uridyltransferase/glucosamine-1-phosphate-acetyltransferase GlmU-like protein
MISAIIVAAGKGTRMGPQVDKLFLELDGCPIVAHTWRRFEEAQCIDELLLAVREGMQAAEQFLIQTALHPMLAEVTAERARETQTITRHLEINLNELIHRQDMRLAELMEMQQRWDTSQPLAANIKQTEDRIDELNGRLEHRRAERERERECMIGDIQHVARAWVLPHPERKTIVKVEHYRLRQDSIKHPVELKEDPSRYRTEGKP